jgi:hypothetical protein
MNEKKERKKKRRKKPKRNKYTRRRKQTRVLEQPLKQELKNKKNLEFFRAHQKTKSDQTAFFITSAFTEKNVCCAMLLLICCFVLFAESTSRADAVRDAFVHSVDGFARHAWAHDEIRPTTNRTNDSWGGFGCVLHDSLDTALIMGLDKIANRIVDQLGTVSFLKDWDAHVFEYTIRYLGSLLSAFELRGRRDSSLLANAAMIGDRLLSAFNSSTGLPFGVVNLETRKRKTASWLNGAAVLAEAGSIQLEFAVLSRETGNDVFEKVSRKAFDFLLSKQPAVNGMFPLLIDIETGNWRDEAASTGALGDSFFESGATKSSKLFFF